jgi:hypothetical protein
MHPRLSIVAASIRKIISAIIWDPIDQFWDRTVLNMRMESADPYWDKKVLGVHFNGANASTTFTDVKGKTISVFGNTQISTAQFLGIPGKSSSAYFDGTDDYLRIPYSSDFSPGTGDYSCFVWIRPANISSLRAIVGPYSNPSAIHGWLLYQGTTGEIVLALRDISGAAVLVTSASNTLKLNLWQHVGWTKVGNDYKVFHNGVIVASTTNSISLYVNPSYGFIIGRWDDSGTTGRDFSGYMTELELYKGVAIHTSNFNPPTAEFSEPSLVDDKGKTITAYGGISLQGSTKKYGTGAVYLDGADDYFTIPNSTDLTLTTGDFTIECWIYVSSFVLKTILTKDGVASVSYSQYSITLDASGIIAAYVGSGTSTNAGQYVTAASAISINTWTHIAFTKSDTSLRLFINGVLSTTVTQTITMGTSSGVLSIGREPSNAAYFQGYIDDLRITKGFARYTSNFTPIYIGSGGSPGDPYYNYTLLLLKMDGANNSTTFTDNSYSPKTVTAFGNAKISTTKSVSSDASGYFDGTGDYVSFTAGSEFDFGTGDFTIECWANPSSSVEQYFISKYVSWTADLDFVLRISATGYASFIAGDNAALSVTSNSILPLNTWTHIAVVRASNVTKMFINGVQQSSTHSGSVNIPNDATTVYIGAFNSGNNFYNGYIDDFRVTKAVARYTANFTPPGAIPSTVHLDADPWWLNTVLALRFDGAQGSTVFTDLKGKTVTSYGNTLISTVKSKFGQAAYFDGTGDYLTVPNNSDFDFGSGNFTIEGWINTSNTNSNIIGKRPNVSWGPFSIIVNAGKLNARYCVTAGSWAIDISSTDSIDTGAWVHFAVVRNGSSFLLFVNGTLQAATGTNASPLMTVTDPVYIGANSDESGALTGYIDDIRVTKGIARWTTTFTPPTKPIPTNVIGPDHDPNWDYKVLGLHMNGADNSTTFTDCKNRTVTVVGDTKIKTDQFAPLTGNTSSAYFDGTGDTLSIANSADFNFSTTPDFTVSFWIYIPTTPSSSQYILNKDGKYGSYYPQWRISIDANRILTLELGSGAGGATLDQVYNSNWPVATNVWTHIEFGRTGTTLQLFQNGLRISTLTQTATMGNSSEPLTIGFQPNSPSGYFNGYIDDLEIYKGVAVHTSNFTPPTTPFIDG